MSRYALLGSPFLGPEVWEPTAAALRARGHRADVVTSTAGDDADSILAELAAALPRSIAAGDDLVGWCRTATRGCTSRRWSPGPR